MCILFYWLQWQANANYSYLKMSTHIMCSHCFFFPTSIQLKDRLIQGDRQIMLPLFEVEVNDNMQLQYYQISINDL
jgi:hypothetical protein